MHFRRAFVLYLFIVCLSTSAAGEKSPLSAEQLFDPQKLVEINIELPKKDWDHIRAQTRSFVTALGKEPPKSPYEYVKGNITINGTTIKDVGIRKKGFLGSLDNDRPSLKIRFDKYVDQSPIQGLNRLTLNNNKQDPAHLSQFLGFRFFNASGSIAPRCSLAKVTVNGKYLGIYSNVESIKSPMLERRFGKGDGALFEGTVADFFVNRLDRIELKNKKAKTKHLKKVAEILAEEKVDLTALEKRIDIKAFIRFWATETLLGYWDGYTNNQNNYFMYRNPANDKLYFIPWGADALFTDFMPLPPYRIEPKFVHANAILANKLYRIPETQKLYHETLKDLLDNHWKEAELLAEVDRVEAMIKDHLRKENQGFKKAVDKARKFIQTRRESLMKAMEKGPAELKKPPRRPPYMKPVGELTATFDTKWYKETPTELQKVGKVKLELILDGKPVEFSAMGAYAEYSKFLPMGRSSTKPPTVVFSGIRKSDKKSFLIFLAMPPTDFQPNRDTKPSIVQGAIIIGKLFGGRPDMKMVGGEAIFDHASTKDGEKVSGQVKLNVMEMTGMKMGRR